MSFTNRYVCTHKMVKAITFTVQEMRGLGSQLASLLRVKPVAYASNKTILIQITKQSLENKRIEKWIRRDDANNITNIYSRQIRRKQLWEYNSISITKTFSIYFSVNLCNVFKIFDIHVLMDSSVFTQSRRLKNIKIKAWELIFTSNYTLNDNLP